MFSDDEDDVQLSINEHFAKAYQIKKEKEELGKLKEKYGSQSPSSESESESESEDEDGEQITPAVDAAILRTLARIKKKDPSIYQPQKDVFQEEIKHIGHPRARKKQQSSKPVTIKQQTLLAHLNPLSRSPSPKPLTHVQEQEALRSETIAAFHTALDDEDELLVPREKTKDEVEQEEEEYREYLQREVGEDLEELIEVEQKEEEKGEKRKKGKGKKESEDQEFLINYILNRGWIDRSTRRLPTYNEITIEEEDASDEDESFEDLTDLFESSYNHRFEEPDAELIPRFPRSLPDTVRREGNTARKEARERKKKRKEEEVRKKREEVARMKTLVRKEVEEKMSRVAREGGVVDNQALQNLDLEGDWDPEAHDQQMGAIYQDHSDELGEKPVWEDDIDIGDIVPGYRDSDDDDGANSKPKTKSRSKKEKKKRQEEKHVDWENEGGDEAWWEAEGGGDEEKNQKTWAEVEEEVDKLGFNDIVAGIPTRFHYTPVLPSLTSKKPSSSKHTHQPNDLELTPTEILLATDTELNELVSLKKLAPYRIERGGKGGGYMQEKMMRERVKELRERIWERARGVGWGVDGSGEQGGGECVDVGGERKKGKRKGKKERLKAKAAAAEGDDAGEGENDVEVKEKKKRKRDSQEAEPLPLESGQQKEEEGGSKPKEEGVEPSKKKRRRHKKHGDHAHVGT